MKEEFAELEFKLHGNCFYRVVNDMYHSIKMHKSVSGGDFEIEFGVLPLCKGGFNWKDCCGTGRLSYFEHGGAWFEYDRNDEKNMDECIETVIRLIKKYLIPLFGRAEDAKSAYYTICNFQEKYCKPSGILMFDYSLYYMSLKAGMYDRALLHAKARREQCENAFLTNKKFLQEYGVWSDESEEYYVTKLKKIDDEINRISVMDKEYFSKIIINNEEEALENLGYKKK